MPTNVFVPHWKRLLQILLLPVVLPAALFGMVVFVMLAACATVYYLPLQIWRERQFRRYLRGRGRVLEESEVVQRLQAGEGTLLEEWGSKGACRIWWTADELKSHEPAMELRERLQALFDDKENSAYDEARIFNRRCLTEYIGKDVGKASLTMIPARAARSNKLAAQFPNAKCVIVVPPPLWWKENRTA